jgi:two-component sensor histidine kinase
VAISLAGLPMRHAPDGPVREQFLRHGHRLKAIGLVYRTLYRDRDLARLDVDGFIGDLCAELGRAYRGTGTAFSIRAEATLLDLDQAVPFALVANELVTNALVHAFGPGDRGTVEVGLHRLPTGLVELTVADDGIGIAPGLLEAAWTCPGKVESHPLRSSRPGGMA